MTNKNNTHHYVYFQASQSLACLKDESINLIVTSPPYPMIEMWDEIMAKQNNNIADALSDDNGKQAFELMHQELDKVWKECFRVLANGGFMCINVGDATRTIDGEFELYNNHSRIVSSCLDLGFTNLPNIIWRKQTNAPNKFMGSGMMPCGAYVTLEHEWILVFRKGTKRPYKKEEEKVIRRDSSFFWEERNVWFSDVWEIKGVKQKIVNSSTRERSASFPLTVPYRLINMYSQTGDIVLDPFFGLGTTTLAAMISGRNSIGIEIDPLLKSTIETIFSNIDIDEINNMVHERYLSHESFISQREALGKEVKYNNAKLSCKVMTKQETDLSFNYLTNIEKIDGKILEYECVYGDTANTDAPLLNSVFG